MIFYFYKEKNSTITKLYLYLFLFLIQGICYSQALDSDVKKKILIYGTIKGSIYIGENGIGVHYNPIIGGPPLGPISLRGIEIYIKTLNFEKLISRSNLYGKFVVNVKLKGKSTKLKLLFRDPKRRYHDSIRIINLKDSDTHKPIKVDIIMKVKKGGVIIPPPPEEHPDSDGDGFPNWIEKIENTDYNDPKDYPR